MGRSVAVPDNTHKTIYIDWHDQYNVDGHGHLAWDDFKRDITRAVKHDLSDSFTEPYDPLWIEDEVQAILENGHAYVTVSEYCGMACIALVEKPKTVTNGWGVSREEYSPLANHYCCQIDERFEQIIDECMGQTYRGGPYASNGTRMYHPA